MPLLHVHGHCQVLFFFCPNPIMSDPRLPFPDSVGGILPGPATTQKVYQGIEWFSQLTATTNDSFEHVDKGDNSR